MADRLLFQLIVSFILFHIIVVPSSLMASEISSMGVPYVKNYPKSVYGSDNQNWSVTKDQNGVMYFGNSEGLLVFDGTFWRVHHMPNRIIVRAVAADQQGRVYAGGFGEFGFWEYDAKGVFSYQSLTHLIPEEHLLKDEVWKIYVKGEKVIFQSFASIYIYENNQIEVVKADNPFLFLFDLDDRFYTEVIGKGLFELKGKQLEFAGNLKGFNLDIHTILPFSKDKFLIGTSKNGLFMYDGETINPWSNKANDFLKTYQLNNGIRLFGKYFAFGTILNGIIIIDESGNIIQQINKSSGLQNNTVLSLYVDDNQNLWAGLDNGIDRIELSSSLYFYLDKTGKIGTVYDALLHENKIYLGTNQGLFYSDWTPGTNFQALDFTLIEQSQGQVWDLSLIDGQLLCGHNNATFRVSGNKIQKISDAKGAWTIKELKSHPAYLIQGTYNGLVLYKKDAKGNWSFYTRISGFSEPSRYIEQDNSGHIWVSHAYKGLYKLKLSENLLKVEAIKAYDTTDGLPTTYRLNVFEIQNQLIFSSFHGIYVYDPLIDKFSPYVKLTEKLGSFANSNKVIKSAKNKYWFINHGKVALLDLDSPEGLKIDSVSFKMLDRRMVQIYENIHRIDSAISLISVDDGFAVYYEQDSVKPESKQGLPEVLIRNFENITNGIYRIYEGGKTDKEFAIPYKDNNIRVSYSLPYYKEAEVAYQYFLKGYSSQWSDWSAETSKDFTNLPKGTYQFLVKARVNKDNVSPEAAFTFAVLPPWYQTVWAFAAYFILFVGLAFFIRHLYFLKLYGEKKRIQQKLEREKEEALRKEAIENEQKIIRLKNEQLQKDLSNKSRELANSALNIVHKNELLQSIGSEITQLKKKTGSKLDINEQTRKIEKILSEAKEDDQAWNLFEESFNETHDNYFKKLKKSYADLTPNDLKLCAYLLMNMSSKEISSLLGITVRSVEVRRYRLRRKLKIEHDENLVEFLMQL